MADLKTIQIAFGKGTTQIVNEKTHDEDVYNALLDSYLLRLNGESKLLSHLDECSVTQEVWEGISKRFSKGESEDMFLQALLDRKLLREYGLEAETTIEYFLAKIDYKKGNKEACIKRFEKVIECSNSYEEAILERLKWLAKNNLEIVNGYDGSVEQYIYSLQTNIDHLQNKGNMPTEYAAYESASIIGKGITNLVGKTGMNANELQSMMQLIEEHDELLRLNKDYLKNQEVVNISLNWFKELEMCISTDSFDYERLWDISQSAFEKSKEHHNNLFYLQSLIVLSLIYHNEGKQRLAEITLGVCMRIMQYRRISMKQEGFGELFYIMKTFICPELYDKVTKSIDKRYRKPINTILQEIDTDYLYNTDFNEIVQVVPTEKKFFI